jgi:histone acetyltransferase (RNA polymerase elongator complex component)
MNTRHVNIPIFVPEEACPNRCVFCNQHRISCALAAPDISEVTEKINRHLSTIPETVHVEVAFFGGNFTGIPLDKQINYLNSIQPYLRSGRVKGIRISTRPDYISPEILKILAAQGVTTIELGAQSLDDNVLIISGRGHTVAEVHRAASLIRLAGFDLGLQMMIGLPGSSELSELQTANEIIKLGASSTRIYPTLVIKETELENMYQTGKYQPLELKQAIERSATLAGIFAEANVTILRIGLHPSEGLLHGENLVAGPFHAAFGEMVYTEVWRRILVKFMNKQAGGNIITIRVAPGKRNAAIGYNAANKKWLLGYFRSVKFIEDSTLKGFNYHVDIC